MALVEAKNIHKKFGHLEVLKGVSLDIEEGEIVVLIGKSGSGKSTFLRCINGLEKIHEGEIYVDNELVSAKQCDLRKLRQKVGMVFQHYNLFPHLTVEGNITLALNIVKKMGKKESHEIAEKVLKQVGLSEKIDAYPDELSGGQQQRVAIARSLAMYPKVMLFDEITSALDPELINEVLGTLEELAKQGMTMVLVTHELVFSRKVASKMVFMNEGVIWEAAPPEEFFTNPKTDELKGFIKSIFR